MDQSAPHIGCFSGSLLQATIVLFEVMNGTWPIRDRSRLLQVKRLKAFAKRVLPSMYDPTPITTWRESPIRVPPSLVKTTYFLERWRQMDVRVCFAQLLVLSFSISSLIYKSIHNPSKQLKYSVKELRRMLHEAFTLHKSNSQEYIVNRCSTHFTPSRISTISKTSLWQECVFETYIAILSIMHSKFEPWVLA